MNSGPTAARTAATIEVTEAGDGSAMPSWAYGPVSVASSLAAWKPISLALVAQLTSESRYSSSEPPDGCSEAYGTMCGGGVTPESSSSSQHGLPAALPLMSQSAMSSAPIAWMTTPRRPFMAVPTYSRCQMASASASGSVPMSMSLSPMPIVCVEGASMAALSIHGFASLSPTPDSPVSVWMKTTRLS